MKFKSVNFKPELVTGWCYHEEDPRTAAVIHLTVDGSAPEVITCNKPRMELDREQFPNRYIGFVHHLPYRFWDGARHHFALIDPMTGAVLRERTLTFPDARVPDMPGVWAQVLSDHPGRISGWVCDGVAPAQVRLDVDGVTVGTVTANVEELRGQPWGYSFVVPGRYFDDGVHTLRLTALISGVQVELASFTRTIARADMPTISAELLAVEPGLLTGRATSETHPDKPLTLALLVNDEVVQTALTDIRSGGAFSFDLAALSIDPGHDIVDLVAEPYGILLPCVDVDLFRQTATWSVTPSADGGADVRLTAIAPVRTVSDVVFDDGSGAVQSPVLRPVVDSPYVAAVTLAVSPTDAASLTLGGVSIVRRDIAVASDIETAEEVAPLPPPAPVLVAADDLRVVDALRAMVLGNDDVSDVSDDTSGPAPGYAGDWSVDGFGAVRGWVIDLAHPGRAVPVELTVNDMTVATFMANLPHVVPQSELPVPLPVGFDVDVTTYFAASGRYKVGLRLPGNLDLPGSRQNIVRYPLRVSPQPFSLGQALNLPPLPPLTPQGAELLLSPVDAVQWTRLHHIFGALTPAEGALPPKTMASALRQLVRQAVWKQVLLQKLADPEAALPHHGALPPLAGIDMTVVTEALPLATETREALTSARTWRAFATAFLGDPALFRYVLKRADTTDALVLGLLSAQTAGGDLPLSRRLAAGPLPDALQSVCSLAAIDPQGRVVLHESVANDDQTRAALTRLLALSDAKSPWTLAVALLADGMEQWKLHSVIWQKDEEPVSEDPSLTVLTIRVSGRQAEVVFNVADEATVLAEKLAIRLGGKFVALARIVDPDADFVDEEAEAAPLTARYVGVIDPPGVETLTLAGSVTDAEASATYDLRLNATNGPRPMGLPAQITVDLVGETHFGDVVFSCGEMRGWVMSTAPLGKVTRLTLVEDLPPPPPEEGADPEAIVEIDPADLILTHARAATKTPVAALQAQYGAGFANGGFTLKLPPGLLDGTPRPLRLLASVEGAEDVVVWSQTFEATEDFLVTQVATCATADELKSVLMAAAAASRVDFLDRYFDAPGSFAPVVLDVPAIFEVLATATIRDVANRRSAKLKRLFDALWTHALASGQRQNDFYALALRVVMAAEPNDIRQRFPHSPLSELALDLVISLNRAKVAPDSIARDAYQARRLRMAQQMVAEAAAPGNTLLATGAQIEMALGNYGATDKLIRQALDKKKGWSEGLMILARNMVRQGKPLDAIATITGGKGLSAWLTQPASYDLAKLFVALDWVGALKDAAVAAGRDKLVADVERSYDTMGAPELLSDSGFSLIWLKPVNQPLRETFERLAPVGCLQVAITEAQGMSEIDCAGGWGLILKKDFAPSPELLTLMFAQRRPFEPVIRIVECKSKPGEGPCVFNTIGALIRADALRAFGPLPFDTFIQKAQGALRVKTVLI